jgi:hypothetical protein
VETTSARTLLRVIFSRQWRRLRGQTPHESDLDAETT